MMRAAFLNELFDDGQDGQAANLFEMTRRA